MGTFVNPSIENFEKDLKNNVFVDKSLLMKELNRIVDSTNCYLCVSRPRRFGKTMAENMIGAYYGRTTDTSHIFNKLLIGKDEDAHENYLKYLNKYNILSIDCLTIWTNREKFSFMEYMKYAINKDLIEEFPNIELNPQNSVASNIEKIYNQTKIKFVILFDEYDLP
ncbi:MAG: AAA family ATPase, partial [Bacteroidales bacterium]|nr:AAA family ATPase [Bacteroidales bacterium]